MTTQKETEMETFKANLRAIQHYRWDNKKNDVVAELHITVSELANQVFQKLARRGMTVALGRGSTWCKDCPKTACWDRGKAIYCNEKRR